LAKRQGATVISQPSTEYVGALAAGVKTAECVVLVTLDGDGEHPIERIPDLVRPIEENVYDVLSARPPRPLRHTEQMIKRLVARRTGVEASSSGFRAIREPFAKNLNLSGSCTCGFLAMNLYLAGARMCSIQIQLVELDQSRSEQWGRHLRQFPRLLRMLMSRP